VRERTVARNLWGESMKLVVRFFIVANSNYS
jgi:hypothetical protein